MPAEQAAPRKRFQVRTGERNEEGHRMLSMVERVPDPSRPNDPKKDAATGPVALTAPEPDFWSAAKRAGFVWVKEDFSLFWRCKQA